VLSTLVAMIVRTPPLSESWRRVGPGGIAAGGAKSGLLAGNDRMNMLVESIGSALTFR
jgi:hypothetical protein